MAAQLNANGFSLGPGASTDSSIASPTSFPNTFESSLPDPTDPSIPTINIPLIALSVSLAAFLLICFSVCACAYRRAKSQNRFRHLDDHERRAQYVNLGRGRGYGRDSLPLPPLSPKPSPRFLSTSKAGEAVLLLNDFSEHDQLPPPAYSPELAASTRRSLRRSQRTSPPPAFILSTRLPTLTPSPSPTLHSVSSTNYSLSPGLSPFEGGGEEARLLALRGPPTPPPPMYVRE